MSKPIQLNDEMRESIVKDFMDSLKSFKMKNGRFSFTKDFAWDSKDKTLLEISPLAYLKFKTLVDEFYTEVAWHGIAERVEDEEAGTTYYRVTDILVYPQQITSGTVTMDETEYDEWLQKIDTPTLRSMRMQGHSHVNFAASPSGVDLNDQAGTVSQLKKDMFYIFMIWNKKDEHHVTIYDMRDNTLYEDSDVEVVIEGIGNLKDFVADAKKVAKPEVKTYGTFGGKSYVTPTYNPDEKKEEAKPAGKVTELPPSKPKEQIGSPSPYGTKADWDEYCRQKYGTGGSNR